MITIKTQGGLGNQMFQYAYGKALSLRLGKDFTLDISSYNNYFRTFELEIFAIGIKYTSSDHLPRYETLYSQNRYLNHIYFKTKEFAKKYNKQHYIEHNFNFNKSFLSIANGYIEGYFQTEKYFIDFESHIRKDFTFVLKPSSQNKNTIENIENVNSISIHIRRGDYITNASANSFHGTCDLNYYKKAIEYIKNKLKNPVFFLFSDDMDWVKKNLPINGPTHYVDWNNSDTNYEDMRLMSKCKHNIIANSSFSWRGAWLNNNPNKIVIAPEKRFNTTERDYSDVVPASWVKL